jgi:glucan endo-1,3-alpha-glucosidase
LLIRHLTMLTGVLFVYKIYFIPAWTDNGDGFSQMSSYDMDGFVNWGAAWPLSTTDITMANDKNIMSLLGTRRLVATVSPLFYTHFSYKVGATSS